MLTLTATPIPRTLHLAMAGLRDLSIIATPPADRRAVRTFVSRVDDADDASEAIERELARGGQVFFITPTIGTCRPARTGPPPAERRPPAEAARSRATTTARSPSGPEYLQALVPKARIGIGHGALPAEQLEKVMVQFVQGELDVLVATTIVESGLDIPRANTMFVARADAFGLAQLYQLRGRIGRTQGARVLLPARARARAHHRRGPPPARGAAAVHRARRRLPDRLAGPRDPRRRRAARRQAVGLDRGGRLRSVRARCSTPRSPSSRGKPIHSAIDPELTIEMPGFIPDDYVPDPGQRLELYKRLSAVDDDDELRGVMAEIADRYGPVPGEVVLLGELMGVKAIARGARRRSPSRSRARESRSRCHRISRLPVPLAVAGWRKLPDGRYSIVPPSPGGPAGARRALLDALARAT